MWNELNEAAEFLRREWNNPQPEIGLILGTGLGPLMEQMQGQSNRRAALVSTLVAVRSADDPEPLVASGRAAGLITEQPIGDGGFGFDPVLMLPDLGQTFAQLSSEHKNQRSHRGQAARQMVALIRERWLSA